MYLILCYLFIGLLISFIFDMLLKDENEMTQDERILLVIVYPLIFILMIYTAIKKNV